MKSYILIEKVGFTGDYMYCVENCCVYFATKVTAGHQLFDLYPYYMDHPTEKEDIIRLAQHMLQAYELGKGHQLKETAERLHTVLGL